MPLAVLAAGGGHEWVQLHDAEGEKHKQFNREQFEDKLIRVKHGQHIQPPVPKSAQPLSLSRSKF